MLPFPRILIIDDQWGRVRNGRNNDRVNFCIKAGIKDVTGSPGAVETEPIQNPVAEAVFCSGQIEHDGEVFNDVEVVLNVIREYWTGIDRWALVLIDMCFVSGSMDAEGKPLGRPGDREPKKYFGLEIIKAIKGESDLTDLPVVALSSMERAPIEKDFGSFVRRFCDKSEISSPGAIRDLLERNGLIRSEKIIGASLPLLKVLREARSFGRGNLSCALVQGERGTGKELLARYVHDSSPRKEGPYITVHCGALSRELLESELFGHEKGSFTGATAQKQGIFERGNRGTVLLDEIGTMQPDAQVKLLRVLQEGDFTRVGGTVTHSVDVRVVAATNTELKVSVEQGSFRSDLFDRLRGDSPLCLPPLRERLDDIPLLAEHFVRKAEHTSGARQRVITKEALDLLSSYPWPGNVRELETVLSNAVEWDNGYLLPEHLNLPREAVISAISYPEKFNKPETVISKAQTSSESVLMLSKMGKVSIDYVIEAMNSVSFNDLQQPELRGRMQAIDAAASALKARYLSSALNVTADHSKPTPEINITKAVRLVLGSESLKTHSGADYIKKLLGKKGKKPLADEQIRLIEKHPFLADALEIACRQRRKNKKK